MILSLYQIWFQIGTISQARYPAWALSSQPLLHRDTFSQDSWGDCDQFLRQAVIVENESYRGAAYVVGWYRRGPWSDVELAKLISKDIMPMPRTRFLTRFALLENLGSAGRAVIRDWERREAEREAKRVQPQRPTLEENSKKSKSPRRKQPKNNDG
jgi:hypothetical protein